MNVNKIECDNLLLPYGKCSIQNRTTTIYFTFYLIDFEFVNIFLFWIWRKQHISNKLREEQQKSGKAAEAEWGISERLYKQAWGEVRHVIVYRVVLHMLGNTSSKLMLHTTSKLFWSWCCRSIEPKDCNATVLQKQHVFVSCRIVAVFITDVHVILPL